MNLFETTVDQRPAPLGFRLQRLEVYNWGTFDRKVWSLDLQGDTSLLTGDVGSGKSTLVDAVITLLVPPRKVTYNKAADASAKERSLTSYVRGYYGQKRTENGGGRPEALRDRDQYSVVLGVFSDRNFGRTVTLAQVFWFPDETVSYPKRFYVLAQKTLSITERFSAIGGDMKSFRKQLEKDPFIRTYDDYPQYGHEFRKIFGIRQVQAMDLFQQTISLKKVDSLTGFVRQNMLEVPDTEQEVDLMLHQYHDLEAAHQAVQRAREQQKQLEPIEALGQTYCMTLAEQQETEAMQALLDSWYAEKAYKIREAMLSQVGQRVQVLTAEEKVVSRDLQSIQDQLTSVRMEMARNGGQQLDEVRHRLDTQQQVREQCLAVRQRYQEQIDKLDLIMPATAGAFVQNQQAMAGRGNAIERDLEDLALDAADLEANRKEAAGKEKKLAEEIGSLLSRKSNIPNRFIKIREELCTGLNLAESEMPFVGELIAVSDEEQEWEGAIERLLRSFGISLLVPEAHYGEVADWMDHHDLGTRMVYYRVPDYVEKADMGSLAENVVAAKLTLREDSPYCDWLAGELAARFRHSCCETMQQFRQAKYALTRTGQVKVNGRRHEKDDRYRIDDRRQYVLGFSNLRKIQSLRDDVEAMQAEQKFFQQKLRHNKEEQRKLRHQQDAIMLAGQVECFSDLDLAPVENELEELQAKVEELRQKNDIYRKLQDEEGRLIRQVALQSETLNQQRGELGQLRERVDGLRQGMAEDLELFAETMPDAKARAYPLLERHAPEALQELEETSFSLNRRQKQQAVYTKWLTRRSQQQAGCLQQLGQQLTEAMAGYRQRWPENCAELLCRPEAAPDYIVVLDRLRTDDLPKFEGRFRELLRENTINQIALFQTHLDDVCQEIEDRIGRINQSLSEIDYNEGRYIQIECSPAASEMITEFRRKLKSCTDDALTGTADATYSELKFRQVADLLERLQGRPGSADADAHWRSEVIDVRNWYTFAASERWRCPEPDQDEEYEHYTDSGGKSGGQKEKLAYTILAASIVYNFGLEGRHSGEQSFRFVVIDEAFLKSSDESARFGLELFQKLDLQLLVVTPLLKIATIEPYVHHVGFVYQKDEEHRSYLRNLTIEELRVARSSYAAENNM